MADEEEKQSEKPIEATPSFLEQVKAEREALEKVREEVAKSLDELKQIKATDILSGRVVQPQQELKPEISPQEYAKNALKGILLEKK